MMQSLTSVPNPTKTFHDCHTLLPILCTIDSSPDSRQVTGNNPSPGTGKPRSRPTHIADTTRHPIRSFNAAEDETEESLTRQTTDALTSLYLIHYNTIISIPQSRYSIHIHNLIILNINILIHSNLNLNNSHNNNNEDGHRVTNHDTPNHSPNPRNVMSDISHWRSWSICAACKPCC